MTMAPTPTRRWTSPMDWNRWSTRAWPGRRSRGWPACAIGGLALSTLTAASRWRKAAEEGELRQRHAEFFAGLAALSRPHLRGADQALWLKRLEAEHDNFRAAIRVELSRRGAGAAGAAPGGRPGAVLGDARPFDRRPRLASRRPWRPIAPPKPTEDRIKALSEASTARPPPGVFIAAARKNTKRRSWPAANRATSP